MWEEGRTDVDSGVLDFDAGELAGAEATVRLLKLSTDSQRKLN